MPAEPILKPLDAIRQMDAILASSDPKGLGKPLGSPPIEPEWPAADVIIGNPPFWGGKRLRSELGDAYVDDLFKLYDGRVPREADLVDGAAVNVSMVGFDGGREAIRELDGRPASTINSNLTAAVDLTQARRLPGNLGLSFMGVTPAGPFDIPADKAREWLALPLNPINKRPACHLC